MNAQDKQAALKSFKTKFSKLLDEAAAGGVPVQNLIMEIGQETFRLQLHVFQVNAERAAAATALKIIPAGAIDLPQSRNGNAKY